MTTPGPHEWRFPGDRSALDRLLEEESVRLAIESGKALQERHATRARLLGGAVMVESAVLPHLAEAVARIATGFPDVGAVECFVYPAADVNAFVTTGRRRTLVAVSSAAVNHLDAQELEFVIGHELGHALFGHTEVAAGHLIESGGLMPASAMRLRAWQRAAEISADRAGLSLCGSIDGAARALFKATSGIFVREVAVSPAGFAAQWQRLVDEVIDEGQRDFWEVSHPFPPLRMQALLLFWEARQRPDDPASLGAANAAVEKMLALMDPAAGDRTLQDPMLAAFFFWGGLYVALADGALHPAEERRLESVAPTGLDVAAAIRAAHQRAAACVESFTESHRARRRKLTAVELHRIVYGLIDVASADTHISPEEVARLRELAAILGVSGDACDLIVAQYTKEAQRAD